MLRMWALLCVYFHASATFLAPNATNSGEEAVAFFKTFKDETDKLGSMLTGEQSEIEELKKERDDLLKTKKLQEDKIKTIKGRALAEIQKLTKKVKNLSDNNFDLKKKVQKEDKVIEDNQKTEALLRKKLKAVGSTLENEEAAVQKMMTDMDSETTDSTTAAKPAEEAPVAKAAPKVEKAATKATVAPKAKEVKAEVKPVAKVEEPKAQPVKVEEPKVEETKTDDDESLSLETDDELEEPVKAEVPVKAEPVKVEAPVKVEPVKAEPVKVEAVKVAAPEVPKAAPAKKDAAAGLAGLEDEVQNLESAVDSAETPADAPAESQSLLDDASSALERAMND